MNPELPLLESKLEQIEADRATAMIQKDQQLVSKYSKMACDCREVIARIRSLDESRRLSGL